MRRLEEKRNGGMKESIVIHRHCYMGKAKSGVHKINYHFSAIFSLFGAISSHISIEGRRKSKGEKDEKGNIKRLGKTRKRKKEIDVQTKRMHNK